MQVKRYDVILSVVLLLFLSACVCEGLQTGDTWTYHLPAVPAAVWTSIVR